MDSLLKLTIPTVLSQQDSHTPRFLNEFINYVCFESNSLDELYYWSDVSRLLPLLDRFQKFLSILNHSYFNIDIQLVMATCSKLLDFCISILNFITNIEKSSSNEKLRILICSFIRGITFLSPVQIPQFSEISQDIVDRNPFPEILFQLSLHPVISTNQLTFRPLSEFRASIIIHNQNYLRLFATSSLLLSLISSLSFFKSFNNLDTFFSVKNFGHEVYLHEVLTLFYFTSIPELIDQSPLSIQMLFDTCISALSINFSRYLLDSTAQFSEEDFTHLSPKSLSKILRYTLDVCDNFAMILRFSHFPDNVEKNFRLFQTTFLLRNMNSILYPTILETRIHSYAHFDLSPQMIEIATWIFPSVSSILSQAKDNNSSPCQSIPHEANLFTYSTPHSRLDYLIDQSPLMSIIITLLINGYSRCYASSAVSTLLQSRSIISSSELSPIQDSPFYPLFQDLLSPLTFLLTSNVPIYGPLSSCQRVLFTHADSVARIIQQFSSSQTSKICFFNHPFDIPYHILRYYSQFTNIPQTITHDIPPPPPNIPSHFISRSFKHPSPHKLNILDTQLSYSFNYLDIPSCYMQFCCDILSLLHEIFLKSQNSVLPYFMNNEIERAHISAFCFLFIEISNFSYEHPVISPNCMLNFSKQLLSTFHSFLYSDFFNNSLQVYFLENIGFKFDKWPLYLSEPKLFILSWMVLYHMKMPVVSNDHFSIRFLSSFITSLEQELSYLNTSLGQHHDVNFPHIQIFLFCFSSVPLNYRTSFLLRIMYLLQRLSKQSFVTLASYLIFCRVVSLFEYFLFHFTTPPQSLGQYIHSCFVENKTFSITQKTPTSPFNDGFANFILNTEFRQLFEDSILFEILDRSNLIVDSTGFSAICNLDPENSLNYADFYCSLIFHSFSMGKISFSLESKQCYHLPHLFNYRYTSLKNILLHLPCLQANNFNCPSNPTDLDMYMILSFNILCKPGRLNQDLSLLLPNRFLQSSSLRSIDVLHLVENFFSTVAIPNTSTFHHLFISTAIIYQLYETISILEQSMDSSPENKSKKFRCNAPLIKFFLSNVATRLIPLIFHVLHILSSECSLYLSLESFDGSVVIENLMYSCAVRGCSDDLTRFHSSSNPELFDSSLTESAKLALQSYYYVSASSFEQLSLFGDCFFMKNYSILDILESYLFSLAIHQSNYAPIFKHCLSTISSLLPHLLHWSSDEGMLSNYIPEVALLVHKAPMISLFPQGDMDRFIPCRLHSIIRDTTTSLLLKNSFYLISLPQLRFFSNATTVLNTYYTIMLQSVKDMNIYRLICNILNNGSSFNYFSPLLLPIYPEFRNSLSLSIHTLADMFIYQKENFIEESSIFLSQLNEPVFLNHQSLLTYFDYAMLGYPGEDEKMVEARCDKLLVLANAISTGCTILPVSTCQFILKSIIPLGHKLLDFIDRLLSSCSLESKLKTVGITPESSGFPLFSFSHPCLNSFLPIITGLAEVHNVHGELLILQAVLSWLPRCKDIVLNVVKSKSNYTCDEFLLQFGTACSFLSDLLEQIKLISSVVKILLKRNGFDGFIDFSCLYSECFDDRINITTSEDDSDLSLCISRCQSSCSPICVTSDKQEANQHWYNCHTCNLTNDHGVCTTCVKVCHKGHDVSYSRLSSIICSCGDKGKQCCCSLSLLIKTHIDELPALDIQKSSSRPINSNKIPTQKYFSDISKSPDVDPELMKLVEAIENESGLKEELYDSLDFIDVSIHALEILSALAQINKYSHFLSSSSVTSPLVKFYDQLHSLTKVLEHGEVLCGTILRSSEGIFENMKFSINEETLNPESLLASFSVVRNSLCSVSPSGDMHSQYMLVALDKGKFTTINRSSFIKSDANGNKNKLNISKICNGDVPFTILRMYANPLCESFVAFCGIRECYVVVLQSNGQVTEKSLPVQVGIEASNYIVKAFWLPLNRTTLGIVTSQFIKIFDLSTDSFSPNFYFCLQSDYIVDSTYVSTSSMIYLYLMTHTGDVYYQAVSPQCVAENGPVFISSKLEVLSDQSLNRVQSGASIYYSHSLQLLFLSYVDGVNLFGSLKEDTTKLKNIVPLTFKDSTVPVTLYEWVESCLQPGFICAFSRRTHSPIFICIHTETVYIHELRPDSAKSRLVGMALDVKSKHSSSEGNTSLILLFDDGSLRVHPIILDRILPLQSFSFSISPLADFKQKEKLIDVSHQCKLPPIPVDVFESCTICDDIEFGGTDVLHVYNQSQMKNRLTTELGYIFNCNPTGFHIDIINTNLNNVFVGIRIKLGIKSILQSPIYVELFHRKIQLHFVNDQPRWFDIAFTREESLHSIRSFQVYFGPSKDSNFHSFVNSIFVYSKTKEQFGWKDLTESEKLISKSNFCQHSAHLDEYTSSQAEGIRGETEFERLMHLSLTLLCESTTISTESNSYALEVLTEVFLCCLDKPLKKYCSVLIYNQLSNVDSYFLHTDHTTLLYVVGRLYLTPLFSLTPEFYQQLLLNFYSIAINRSHNISILMDKSFLRRCCESFVSSNQLLTVDEFSAILTIPVLIQKIVSIFWLFYKKRPITAYYASICYPGLNFIQETISIITGILYSFMVTDVQFIPLIIEHIFNFVLSDSDFIWESCISSLCSLLRPRSYENLSYNTKEDSIHRETFLQGDSNNKLSFSLANDTEIKSQNFHEKTSFIEDILPLSNQNSGSIGSTLNNEGRFSQQHHSGIQIEDDNIINLALAITLEGQETNNSDNSSSVTDIPLGHLSNVLPVPQHELSTTANIIAGEQSGDQSSTGTLTPPISFPLHDEDSNDPIRKQKSLGLLEDNSSDQGGDTSPDDSESCDTRSSLNHHDTSDVPSELSQCTVESLPIKCRKSNISLYPSIISEILPRFPLLRGFSGFKAMHVMQLFLTLISGIQFTETSEKLIFCTVSKCLQFLRFDRCDVSDLIHRTPENEATLIVIRFLSILLVREKKDENPIPSNSTLNTTAWYITADLLSHDSSFLTFCFGILKIFIESLKLRNVSSSTNVILSSNASLLPHSEIFCCLSSNNGKEKLDIFQNYEKVLIETIMRLPCQLKRICDFYSGLKHMEFCPEWLDSLCEYMDISNESQGPGRRNVRKLLLYLAGSRESYRKLRDLNVYNTNMQKIFYLTHGQLVRSSSKCSINAIQYDDQVKLLHCLSLCLDCATSRPINWQHYCIDNEITILFLIFIATRLHEEICGSILHLICCAICGFNFIIEKSGPSAASTIITEVNYFPNYEDYTQHTNSYLLLQFLNCAESEFAKENSVTFQKFTTFFLLDVNSNNLRHLSLSFFWAIFSTGSNDNKELLLHLLWSLAEYMLTFGQKAFQFVELLSHCSYISSPMAILDAGYLTQLIYILKLLDEKILAHPNSNIYRILSSVVELDGYYLECQPCVICNNPEIQNNNLKLMSIKSDSKFTGNSIILKLSNSYVISSILLKVTDIKRHKLVKTLKIYYSNRIFQSAIDLKNAKDVCYVAKEFTLQTGQHEAKIQFILPITASNLIIEYSDFYENEQSSPEILQCPRCSTAVPVHPGICSNCSENVFQCHKCRAINYDEKDAFLCNSCGFSKYGKFDYIICAKLSSSFDKIHNEQERMQTVNTTTNLLEKADQIYKQLLQHRQVLDLLLIHETSDISLSLTKTKVEPISIGINKYIHMINQKYSSDCKSSFNELSKIIQGVLAGRKEIISYDLTFKCMTEGNFSSFSGQTEDYIFQVKCTSGLSHYFARFGSCYGCVERASKHCVSLLMNLSRNPMHKSFMIQMGLLTDLCNTNLRIGTSTMQNEVRDFILRLNTDELQAAKELMQWLTTRIRYLIKHHQSYPNFAHAVYHEILLLKSTMQYDDTFWEQRLRYMMKIFRTSICHSSVIILECIALPCLKILLDHVYFTNILSCKYASMLSRDIYQSSTSNNNIYIEFKEWIICKSDSDFDCQRNRQTTSHNIPISKLSWLKNLLFHPSSQHIRISACLLVKYMMKDKTRKKLFIDLLFTYLAEVPSFGESAHEYLDLILNVFVEKDLREYLSSKGVLMRLGEIISSEISRISILEESTIHVNISLGYVIKVLSTLLYQLMCNKQLTNNIECSKNDSSINNFSEAKDEICRTTISPLDCLNDSIFLDYKTMLLPIVFDVYLSMKRLVIQRTKRVEDAQEIMYLLLELLTSGTFIEKQKFVLICVEKLTNVPSTDHSSSVYIFEELCSIISPEDFEDPEFFISLEKDPQQEEFLQGRMQNNPYKALDSSIGLLMRDVKNKICRDTELLALLEEDTGMELLVCDKIISLDLSVKEVYQRVWRSKDSNAGNIMKITYRMRGLLGEATEDMIEYFAIEKDNIEDEEKYIVSSVMSQCGGLDAVIYRLACLHNPLHTVKLLTVSLKLLSLCVKLQVNRIFLLKSTLNSINTLLNIFTSIIELEGAYEAIIGVKTLEDILQILFSILHEASSSSYLRINSAKASQERVVGEIDQLKLLFSCINNSYVQKNTEILKQTMKLIPYLTYGDTISMQVILDYFSRFLNFEEYDNNPLPEHSLYLDSFCAITEGISSDDSGLTLKDMILDSGIVFAAIHYIHAYTPSTIFQQLNSDWELFLKRPSLPFVLRFLGGICINHSKSQDIIAEIIPNLHLTEKATTSKGIGTLAENLLNNLVADEHVYSKVIETRNETHTKQVHLAQVYQEKSLAELGITIFNGKIQLDFATDVTSILEESGLICCICMEGYINHPRKILGIYTFYKSCQMEDFENISRKTLGYTSVSGFNIVHLDCHNTAIRTSRQSRGKEEWESASIHNSNIRCNSIMPVWGPEVQDNGYLSCLAKHYSSLQDSTGFREPSFWSSIHDLKILLFRYGFNISFSEESGGGSRFSNMQYLCYFVSYLFYLLNSSSSFIKEEKTMHRFFDQPPSEWVISSYCLDSPLYFLVASIFILSGEDWLSRRLVFLERIIIVAHSRFHSNSPISIYLSSDVLDYNVYRPYLIVYGIVTRIHEILKKPTIMKSDNFILDAIQEYKFKDKAFLAQFESLIEFYEEELLPSDSFSEFCDVIHILDLIPNPVLFLSKLIHSHNST